MNRGLNFKRMGIKERAFRLFFFFIVIVLCFVFLSPFLIMVTTSFKTNADAFTVPVKIFPRKWIFDNYPHAFNKIPYWRYMANTIFITLFCVVGQLFSTPLVSYSISKIKWKGAKIINTLIFSTMMIPVTVTMVPLYRIYAKLGLLNTYVPLILPSLFGSSFYIVIMRQFFYDIPTSLLEAATIDGASEWQRYWKIAIPLCKPVLTTVGIYAFLRSWSDYLMPMLFINETKMYTLSLGLQQYMNEYTVDWTLLMAATTIFVLPVIIVFIIFQKNFVQGVTSGGVKG